MKSEKMITSYFIMPVHMDLKCHLITMHDSNLLKC